MIDDDLAALQEAFGPPQPRDPLPYQPSLFDPAEKTGAELRDAGIARALAAADRLPSAWSAEACYAALLKLAEEHAWVDTDMLAAAYPVTCPSPNALGGIWLRAVTAGVLVDKGRSMRTKQPGKHSHRYVQWYSMRFKVGAPAEGDAA